MKLITIDPIHETVLRSLPIFDQNSVNRAEKIISQDMIETHTKPVRVIVANGGARILGETEGLPVPAGEVKRK